MKSGKPTVNPAGRKGKSVSRNDSNYKEDGYASALTGLGVAGYDKRLGTTFTSDHVTRSEAIHLWTGDDIAARAIDIPVEDAFRQGFQFTAKPKDGEKVDTKALQDAVLAAWTEIHALEVGQQALGYEMAYGGCGVLLGFEGLRPEELVRPIVNSTRPLKFLNVFEPTELPALYHNIDPFAPDYGKPAVYTFSPIIAALGANAGMTYRTGLPIDARNMYIMPGIRVSKGLDNQVNQGWGESIYSRLWRVLRDFNTAWGGVGNLITDFSQTVMKLKNLAQLLSETGGSDALKKRLQNIDYGRSILRSIVIDSEEDVERKTTNVTGLAELLQQYMARVSSAAGGIPITKLFGVAPSGLNSSGESDINQWDDRVKSLQDKKVIPYLRRITEVLIASGAVPGMEGIESWKIEANPLRQPTVAELAAARKTQAETDQIYINAQVLSPDDVANSRWGGDGYSFETVIDWEAREELQKAMAEAAELATQNGGEENGEEEETEPDEAATDPEEKDAPGQPDAEEEEEEDEAA